VVAQDFDADDTFAAVVQSVKHAVQHMFSTVGGIVLVSLPLPPWPCALLSGR
jgi:hypothetical protein